jgi:predicted transposase/invertase (TIGR01784 family)
VEEVVKMDMAIQLAQDKMEMIARDPELLRAYEQYEKAASDWTTEINGALQAEKAKIAKNLKSMAIPVDKITVATGLSPEEIAKL